MRSSVANQDAPSSILNVTELKIEYLPWSESSMQHQKHHGFVTLSRERGEELVNLFVSHGTWYALYGPHPDCPPNRTLAANIPHERTMPLGNASEGRVIHFLNGILFVELAGNNQVLVEGRDGGKETVDRGRRKASCRLPFNRCTERHP